MVDMLADGVESDEEPPDLTDSDDNDSLGCDDDVPDYALGRKVRQVVRAI